MVITPSNTYKAFGCIRADNRDTNIKPDPETRCACLFARCRCGAARAGTVVWPAAASAAAMRQLVINN